MTTRRQLHVAEIVAALGLLVAELTLLGLGVSGVTPAAPLVAAHALVAVASAVWAWSRPVPGGRCQWLLVLSTAACGPLGPAGVLLAMAQERIRAGQAQSLDAWHEMLFPPTGADEQAELWRRVGQRASDRPGDQRVTPFLDVLAFGSVQQRQAVVGIIAMQFKPAFAPALKAALRDQHNVVRVQAATALARLEQEFLERTLDLEEAVVRDPHDVEALLALATHYDEQAFNGLLDPAREQECRAKAARGYEEYLRLRPDDRRVDLQLARLQLRRRLPREAEPRFRRLVGAGHPGASLWLMESLFAQKKYAEVRAVACAAAGERDGDAVPDVDAALGLWRGGEAVVR